MSRVVPRRHVVHVEDSSSTLLPTWWPMAALTIAFPFWWILGISAITYPIVALLLVPSLLSSERVRIPRYFGIWTLFMFLVVLSATQIGAFGRLFAFGYRFSVYFAATVLFLWVYQQSEQRLSTHRVMSFLVTLWCAIAIGGLVGALFPA